MFEQFYYEPCLKNVSNTVKNRYKGNLTMKIDYFFYWWSAFKHKARGSARIKFRIK
jgi:hypothetical protein